MAPPKLPGAPGLSSPSELIATLGPRATAAPARGQPTNNNQKDRVIREAREHQQLTGTTLQLNAHSTVGREAGKGRHGSQRGPEGMGALGALEL